MSDAMIFIFSFALFAILHSFGASDLLKRAISDKNGDQPSWYRLFYNIFSAILFSLVLFTSRNSTVIYFAPGLLSLLLYAVQTVLAVLLLNTLRQTEISDFIGFKQIMGVKSKNRLVTSGWYSIVRHPLYFLSLLFLISKPVMTVQGILLFFSALIYFLIGAKIEEKRLLKLFGDEYKEYQRTVPFIFPNFKFIKQKRSISDSHR